MQRRFTLFSALPMKSYDYAHRAGVRALSWDDFASLAARLAEQLAAFQPQAIVGVARAGLFPATAVACSLRCELYPARLTRRLNDEVIYPTPVWKTPVSPEVAGKVVAVVDEIADSGQTLALVAEQVRALGAARLVTAALVSHSWASPAPDVSALASDAFVIFPWDRQVLAGGQWQPHPEVLAGLAAQAAPAAARLRVVEIRRHAERDKLGEHLNQAGVALARQVGAACGPFERVITSALPRAFETALAMGFAVDEQHAGLNIEIPGLMAEIAGWPGYTFADFARIARQGGAAAQLAQVQASLWRQIASELPEGGAALLVSHGGIIEIGAAGCLPEVDFAAWGAPCGYCEGLRLFFDGQQFVRGEMLRVTPAML